MNKITLIRLLDPPIVAVSAREGLAIYVHADGSVTTALGSDTEPAETANYPAHLLRCIGLTFLSIADSADAAYAE